MNFKNMLAFIVVASFVTSTLHAEGELNSAPPAAVDDAAKVENRESGNTKVEEQTANNEKNDGKLKNKKRRQDRRQNRRQDRREDRREDRQERREERQEDRKEDRKERREDRKKRRSNSGNSGTGSN